MTEQEIKVGDVLKTSKWMADITIISIESEYYIARRPDCSVAAFTKEELQRYGYIL
jgi:hypothetical protein